VFGKSDWAVEEAAAGRLHPRLLHLLQMDLLQIHKQGALVVTHRAGRAVAAAQVERAVLL
jgi:hypothetical protein